MNRMNGILERETTKQEMKMPDTSDDTDLICPYCGKHHHQEAEDFDDAEHEEECDGCGKTFLAYDEASVTHHARAMET